MRRFLLILACYGLLLAGLSLVSSCQSPAVFSVTGEGKGDVRFDGDSLVVVGEMSGRAAVSVKGQPLVILPSWNVQRGYWYARSASRGYERSAPLSEPLPAWARELYSPQDLESLRALGIELLFDADVAQEPGS